MDVLFALVGLGAILAFFVFAVGLIKPTWVKAASRKQVLLRMLIAFITFVATVSLDNQRKPEKPEKQELAASSPTVNEDASAQDKASKVQSEIQQVKANAEAEQAKQEAEKAKMEAEAAKAQAEQAKQEAEKAKAEAEAVKAQAEQAKQEVEKIKAEQAKQEAEKLKAEQAKQEAEKAKAEQAKITPVIDITKLAGASKSDVSKLLGKSTGCESSKYGEKCTYEKLDAEIVYVKNKANFITLSDLKTINYDEHAIEYLGLKPAVPDAVGADSLFWKNQQGLLEIKVFKGSEGKVFYAYTKAFADFEEAEAAVSSKGNNTVESTELIRDINPLPLTVSEFEQRFKKYNVETGIGLSLDKAETEIKTGAVGRKISRYDFGEAVLGMIVEYLESNNQLTSVVLIAGGDSENPLKAVANMLSAMVGIIAAVDPSLSKDQRADLVMKKLGVSDLKIGESSSYQNNGIDYSYQINEVMGFIFTINKVE